MTGPIVAEVLGVHGIGAAVGIVTTSRALGILVGPWAVGVSAHRFGSYDAPFLARASLALIAALLIGELYRRMTSHSAHQAATARLFSETVRAQAVATNEEVVRDKATPIGTPETRSIAVPCAPAITESPSHPCW